MDKKEKLYKKKAHIIDALERLLDTNVYSNISIEDVATEAGLSKGGLRHYFPTKELLFTALIENFFNQIEKDNILSTEDLDTEDKAFITTLFSIEKFMLNKRNIKIFINMILYGFEDDKIMLIIQKFLRNHLNLLESIIRDSEDDESNVEDPQFSGRIAQIILLCAGLFESIDPIEIDPPKLIKFILNQSKI